MGQEEIFNFLEKNKGRFTNSELAEELGYSKSAVANCTKKLRERNEIKFVFGLCKNLNRNKCYGYYYFV